MWSTPHAHDAKGGGRTPAQLEAHRERTGAGARNLYEEAPTWPTPGANDDKGSAQIGQRRGQLDEAAEQKWRTPGAGDDQRGVFLEGEPTAKAGQHSLTDQTGKWASPKATDSEQGPASTYARGNAPLNGEAANWPTPTAEDSESSGNRNLPGAGNTLTHASRAHGGTSLVDASCRSLPPDATVPPGDGSSPTTPASRRRLNPRFVSWLMGWPLIGGTTSGSSATALSRYRQRMRHALSLLIAG
jgi:hypothetical protein